MCGRYTIRRIALKYYGLDSIEQESWFEEFSEHPHFNIAPSQTVPIIRNNSEGERVARGAEWGFIASWTKGKPKVRPINVRAETAATSPMFRDAMAKRRCLIPADGFYEWQGAKPPKQPYFIHRKDDEPFAFAGIWERWRPATDAEPIDTYAILTTTPNAVLEPIHNRMPCILDSEDYQRWLDRTQPAETVADLLKPYFDKPMEARKVSTRVNNVRNQGAELLEELA
jgi:putative SOS response-associated peptidase YedK